MKRLAGSLTIAVLVAVPLPAAEAGQATRELEGTVVSVNRDKRTFRLRDDGRVVTIRVTRRTTFDDIRGFRALRAGMRDVEVDARRSKGRWIARHIDRDDEDDDSSGPGDGDDRGNSGPG